MMWKQQEDLSAYPYQGTSVCTLVEATVSFLLMYSCDWNGIWLQLFHTFYFKFEFKYEP